MVACNTGKADLSTQRRCEANVWVKPGYWHKMQCQRNAKDEYVGTPLCAQHAKKAREKGLTSVL